MSNNRPPQPPNRVMARYGLLVKKLDAHEKILANIVVTHGKRCPEEEKGSVFEVYELEVPAPSTFAQTVASTRLEALTDFERDKLILTCKVTRVAKEEK